MTKVRIPVDVDLRQSISELRRIYSDMSDEDFARWYEKRYRVKADVVLRFIQRGDKA